MSNVAASFDWTCPDCDFDQVEYITLNGPFGVIRCENCRHQFAGNDLPRETDKAWLAAIEEVEAQR